MKKTILLVITFINLMIFSNAQKSSFGVTGGATLASYKIDVMGVGVTSDSRVGYSIGAFFSVPMGKSFCFQPGLSFLQKGGTIKDDSYEDNLTLSYLELPLNFVYYTSAGKRGFFCGAGPAAGWGLSGKDKYSDGTSDDIHFGSSSDDDFKAFELSANILAGYQFKKGFMIAANYNFGLTNTANNDPDYPDYDATYHNRYWGLRLGYMFPGKKK